MREFVEDGTVTAFALWNPGDLGYLAAYAAKALVDGDITGAEGDTFDGRQARRVHRRRRRRRPPRRPVRLQRGQHRRLRLLSRHLICRSVRDLVGLAGSHNRQARPPPRALSHDQPHERTRADATRLLPAPGEAGSARGVQRTPRGQCGPTCSAALADDRLAQLLALPARRRPADRLRRDTIDSTTPWPAWPRPR